MGIRNNDGVSYRRINKRRTCILSSRKIASASWPNATQRTKQNLENRVSAFRKSDRFPRHPTCKNGWS